MLYCFTNIKIHVDILNNLKLYIIQTSILNKLNQENELLNILLIIQSLLYIEYLKSIIKLIILLIQFIIFIHHLFQKNVLFNIKIQIILEKI